jgi:HK97 family phage portal protein
MILSKALSSKKNTALVNSTTTPQTLPQVVEMMGGSTRAGQVVTAETSKNVATAYRCLNILSDDIAKLPLQVYISRQSGQIERQRPDAMTHNLAWLVERKPNRWWSPFQFWKQFSQWLIAWGNGFIWTPPAYPREQFILPANKTSPVFDVDGNLWYATRFGNDRNWTYLPDVEIMHCLINPDETGFVGRGVIQFARETIGRQLAAYGSQSTLFKNGLSAAGIMWLAGESSAEQRKKVREMYEEVMSGDENNGRIAVLDKKISKFEPVTLAPKDVQFLELIADNDVAVMNYFGMPAYKLNTGKQAYNSNEQQNLDYLSTSLDPYLVQIEQAGALKWLSLQEQGYTYLRFERSALFRTDAKSRGDYLNGAIQNGRLRPNEARQIEDRSADPNPLADALWMASNVQPMSNTQGVPNGQ